jgi:hypothetical protein
MEEEIVIEDCPSLDVVYRICISVCSARGSPHTYGKHFGTRSNIMPSIMDAPELREFVATHDLTIERPQTRRARPGFWHMLAHKITTGLYYRPFKQHAPSCRAPQLVEASMDRLVREHPSLSVYALSLI